MSVFDLTDIQKDKIAKTQGFVVYEPYKTVVPAYNLNAIQNFILENDESISELKNDLIDNSNTANENLEELKTKLEKDIQGLDSRVSILEAHSKTYRGITFKGNNNSTTGWNLSNGSLPYIQTVEVEGITEDDTPIVWLDLENNSLEGAALIVEEWPLIGRIVAGDNSLTAYCYDNDVPTANITVMAKVVKDT